MQGILQGAEDLIHISKTKTMTETVQDEGRHRRCTRRKTKPIQKDIVFKTEAFVLGQLGKEGLKISDRPGKPRATLKGKRRACGNGNWGPTRREGTKKRRWGLGKGKTSYSSKKNSGRTPHIAVPGQRGRKERKRLGNPWRTGRQRTQNGCRQMRRIRGEIRGNAEFWLVGQKTGGPGGDSKTRREVACQNFRGEQ